MGSSNKTISYTIDIGADITKARQAAEQLQATFKKSFGDGSNKGMFNLFSGLEKALDTLERKGSQKITSIADAKALEKAKKDVIEYFDAIEREGKKIGNLGGADFKKRLEGLGTQLADSAKAWKIFEDAQKSANKEAEKQSSDIQKKIDDNKKLIQSMRELKAAQDVLNQELTSSKERVTAARDRVARANMSSNFEKSQLGYANAYAAKKEQDYQDFLTKNGMTGKEKNDRISLQTSYQFITTDEISKAKKLLNYVTQIESAISKEEKKKIGEKDFTEITRLKAERERAKQEADDYLKQHNMSRNAVGKLDEIAIGSHNAEVEKKVNETIAAADGLKKVSDEAAKSAEEAQKRYTEAQKEVVEAQKEVTAAQKDVDTKQATYDNQTKQLKSFSDELKKNREEINQSRQSLRQFIDTSAKSNFDQLKEALRGIFGDEFVADMENSEEGLKKIKEKLDTVGDEKMDEARLRIQEFLNAFKESGSVSENVEELNRKVEEGTEKVQQLTDTQKDIENFINKFKQFFSLTNGFMLLKRSIKDAINTTKELDAVMTQTAVVSKNTVSDMWKTLPQYTEEAKKLGTAIKDVYSAQTLYVQQGLDMNSAMQLGVETLKMARVAGIDAAAATDTMTAALRGFKMELNETSAIRINDVYSKLAQNTASNVQEISTAMTKVAALANSANMSFENTAAFLAKIIESTREGAETAGTALKTVIARFTEVKKLYSEGELTGTDEEGQEVDVNKIGVALRTAGINMNDFFTGAKGLDEIFIELGQKWDSLTTVQQRYIATMAAGSRQQSRFLALMQDFSRTTELTSMAYNSAGSSQEQFEKTLDSLEAKVNKLKDEWQSFIMGLANNEAIKWFIDTGTNILNLLNDIIDKLSGGNGLAKSILSVAAAVGTFKAGSAILKGGFGKIGTLIGTKQGEEAGKGFLKSFTSTIKDANKGEKGQAAKNFLGQKFNFINKEKFTTIDTGKVQNKLMDLSSNIDFEEYQDDLYAWQNAVKEFGADSKQAQEALDKLGNTFDKVTGQGKEFQKIIQDNIDVTEKASVNMQALSNVTGIVGGAFLFLSGIFSQFGETGEGVSKVLKVIGISLVAFSTATKIAQAAAAAFGVTLKTSLPIIGAVAAAIAGLIAIIALFRGESDEERLKRLSEQASAAREAADSAAQAYNDLLSGRNTYNNLKEEIAKLTRGTNEWKTKVQELNQEIIKLKEQFPELEFKYNTQTGLLEIEEKSWDKAIENANNKQKTTSVIASLSSAQYERKKTQNNTIEKRLDGIGVNTTYFKMNLEDDYKLLKYVPLEQIYKNFITQGFGGSDNKINTDEEQSNFLKVLEAAINDLDELDEAYKESFDDLVIYSKDFVSSVSLLTDGSKEAYTSLKIFSKDIVKELEKNLEEGATDWEDHDFNEKKTFEEKHGYNSRWDFIISTANKQGLISAADFIDFQSWNGEDNKEIQKLAALLQGKDSSEYKNYDIETAENIVGLYYEAQAGAVWVEDLEKILKGLSKDLQEALVTYATNSENLTKYQIDLINEYFRNSNGLFNNLFEDFVFPNLATWKIPEEIEKENSKYYTRAAEDQYKNFKAYNEGNLYTDLYKAIAESGLGDEKITAIFAALNSADITSIDNLWKTLEILKGQGIDLEKIAPPLYNSFVNFIKELDKAGIAIKTWTETTATEAIQKTRGLANELREKQDKTFKKEDYEFLKETFERTGNTELLKHFILQTDGSYKFVGEDLTTIIKTLDTIADKIPDEYIEQAENKANASKFISDKYKDDFDNYYLLRKLSGRYQLSAAHSSLNTTKELKTKIDEGTATQQDVEDYLNEMSIDRKDFYKSFIQTDEDKAIFSKAGLKLEFDEDDTENWELFVDFLLHPDKYQKELDDAKLSFSLVGEDNPVKLARAIKGSGEYSGLSSDDKQLASEVLQTMLLETSYAETLYDQWNKNDEISKEMQSDYKALAILSSKYNDSLKKLGTSLKDSVDNFKKATEGTEEWYNSLDEIKKALRTFYGPNFKITNDQLIKGMPLIEKIIKGGAEGEQAGREFGEQFTDGIYKQLNTEQEGFGKEIKELTEKSYSKFDSGDFEPIQLSSIPVQGDVDTTDLINNLQTQLDELAKYTGTIYEVKLSEDEESIEINAVYNGFGGISSAAKSGGGGGGGGKDFENDFDKYYNMVEDINELQRLRNLLETDYNQLLESEAASGKEIYDNLKQQVKLLRERRDITADLAEKRKQQIIDELAKSENQDLSEYAWWNNEDLTIEINWDKINEVKDSELGDRIKDFVKTLEDFQSKYDEQIEALEDIESTLQEIEKRGRDQYTSLEDRVRDALIKRIQDQIDELTATDEGISTANQKLLDSIQNTLDKQRQERDNAKTEEELSDKEQRLAYLRQDSSNANALEIVQLEKELADERQSYTDQLIDQKISELQEQNDEAAEQRQEQIDLLQQSLDWQEKNGEFWEQAYEIMNQGFGPDGTLVTGSELEQLLKEGEGWQALSQEGRMNWLSDLETMVAEAVGYLYLSRQLEKIGTKAGTEITFTDAEGNTHTGKVDKDGNVVIDNGDGTQTVWKDVYQSYDGSYRTLETEEDAKKENKPTTSTQRPEQGVQPVHTETKIEWIEYGGWDYDKNDHWKIEYEKINGKITGKVREKKRSAHSWGGNDRCIVCGFKRGGTIQEAYATGGLNTKTGPAWLDGTPSHPELVLNARDTENFIQLKDTLSDLRKYGTSLGLNGGDNYYDIDVHVDEISSDYDVDKLADRLKTLIYKDGQYRNVNVLNRLR